MLNGLIMLFLFLFFIFYLCRPRFEYTRGKCKKKAKRLLLFCAGILCYTLFFTRRLGFIADMRTLTAKSLTKRLKNTKMNLLLSRSYGRGGGEKPPVRKVRTF